MDYITNNSNRYSASDLYRIQQVLIYRHIAYLNALRIQLRSQPVEQANNNIDDNNIESQHAFNRGQLDKELSLFLYDDEVEYFIGRQNPATQIIRCQSKQLKDFHTSELLSDFYRIDMERLLSDFYSQQGAAKQIKSFPFPQQYAFFSYLFVILFLEILPFCLPTEMGEISSWHMWLITPLYTVIAWVYYAMEILGDTSENPFENNVNDVPMTAICRNIEIDLHEMLGETEIPQRIQTVDNILM